MGIPLNVDGDEARITPLTAAAGVARFPLVLWVNDLPDALGTYVQHLQRHSIRVAFVSDLTEAIDRIRREEHPAIVVMDLERYGPTATYAMRLLRVDTSTKDIPIVAFIAQGEMEQHEQALREGFDAVITTPCVPNDVLNVIQPYLHAYCDRRSSDRRVSDRQSSNGVEGESPQCPQCDARRSFQVGAWAQAAGPRWFRCESCGEIWLIHNHLEHK